MTSYLLDTSIISLTAPGRPTLTREARQYLDPSSTSLFLSTVTVVEIEQGIETLRFRPHDAVRAGIIETWLEQTIDFFGERVLTFDVACAMEAGRLSARTKASGRHPGFADIAIAATAAAHGLTVLTANEKHFVDLGVPYRNPLAATDR